MSISGSFDAGVERRLDALVRNFDRDGPSSGRLIRELLNTDRQSFLAAAVRILTQEEDTRGSQFLTSLLVNSDLLLPALRDAALTRPQGVALAQAAIRAGVKVDVLLAKHVSEYGGSDDEASQNETHRLMDILSDISDGTRILPCLMALARQANPYVQSKAVLMIGRMNHSVKWVQQKMAEPDARVRANAVEALWGNDTEEARQILRAAANDTNNRVIGNALLGLYRMGEVATISQLLKLSTHPSRIFRATAAWVMGATGDGRFARALGRMVAEPNIAVRTRAFAALRQIRVAAAQARLGSHWRVVVRFLRNRRSGWREFLLDIDAEPVKLLATHLLLTEDSQEVLNYALEERVVPPFLAVTFLFPRNLQPETSSCVMGARKALEWKRPPDLWAIGSYLPPVRQLETTLAGERIGVPQLETSEQAAIPYTCDPQNAAAALDRIPSRMDCPDLWNAIRNAASIENGPARGQRHLLVHAPSKAGPCTNYSELATAALASQTAVHVISSASNTMLGNLAQLTRGSYDEASDAECGALMEQVYLSLMARYVVRYQPVVADGRELRVFAATAAGWGEGTFPIPALLGKDG